MTFYFGDYRVNTISLLILFCYSYILLFFDLLLSIKTKKPWTRDSMRNDILSVNFQVSMLGDLT